MSDASQRICLITPPSPFLLDERVFMHIGILKVASSLEERGYKVDFLDLSGIDNYLDVLKDYCTTHDTDTYGITASTAKKVLKKTFKNYGTLPQV